LDILIRSSDSNVELSTVVVKKEINRIKIALIANGEIFLNIFNFQLFQLYFEL